MRSDLSSGNLHRRLAVADDSAATGQGTDSSDDVDVPEIPSWVPDGRATHRQRWLTAIRADPGRAGGIALAVIAAFAVLVALFTLLRDRPQPVVSAKLPAVEMVSSAVSRPGASAAQPPDRQVVVSVVGLVHQPGLVTLEPGARIADAVQAAGGALDGADTIGLNLAGHVVDGQQIVVGVVTPAGQPAALGSSVSVPGAGVGAASGKPAASAPDPAKPIDLNTATVEQLDALPGIGPVTAAAIIAWRQTNGDFGSVDELGDVDGIGPARLEKLRALVVVGR